MFEKLIRALLHDKNPHFSCVTKISFELLAPIESSCSEDNIDFIEDFDCSLDKHRLDTSPNRVESNTRQTFIE